MHAPRPGNCQALRGPPEHTASEQRRLPAARRGRRIPEVPVRLCGSDAAALGALQKAVLDEERFVHFLQRSCFFAYRGCNGSDPNRPSFEFFYNGAEYPVIHFI